MEATQLDLPGVVLVRPDVFGDARGRLFEVFARRRYEDLGIPARFVQDNYSRSSKGVVRGLHFQARQPQGKLVTVLRGAIWDVAVDVRRGSPHFGRWVAAELSDEDHAQLWIPEGFAHGFCVLSDTADVLYKNTAYYAPDDQCGVPWDDPSIGVAWPLEGAPVLSAKDTTWPALNSPDLVLPVFRGERP